MNKSLDDIIALHKDLIEKTPYSDKNRREMLVHALQDFNTWKRSGRK